ncbi:caspase family protein [Sinorhizobium sp. RAC02]|uniref:caspase family protein n=1 Tax=Sinorhizobium sp. RAC02 TaxID=1842534 RepID=UPI000857CA9A|nr:caspase family protein [Sinorhizobium sp. RAC02]AOF93407.1 caspase domain protein [Sinorhizobium sp. RAC02]
MRVMSVRRILVFIILLLPVEAAASVRHALLIGNSRYEVATPLRNPENDIEIVGAALEKSGFAVTKVANAKAADTLAAVDAFVARLATVENPVVMVYFAGHGVQISGQNYLLPVDVKLGTEEELRSVALSLSELTRRLDAVRTSLQIVVLDSCRDNPFEQTRGLRRGLATAPERLGRIVAFSTSPGNLAADGNTGASPYAAALAESVTIPGLSIEGVFKRVRATVQERTGGKQEPWENSAVYGDFQFVAGKPAEAGGDEVAFFEFAALADSQEAYRKYLSRYPQGMFANLAKQKIEFMDKDFSFRRQNEVFRDFTFSTPPNDPCGRGSFAAGERAGEDIADDEIILLDLFFNYPDEPCKNTVFVDSLIDIDGGGVSKNRIIFDYFGDKFYRSGSHIPFDPAPYVHFLEKFDQLFFTYRNMHKEGDILLEMSEPAKAAMDYIDIESCEGTCFGVTALVKARAIPEEELMVYRFEVVNAAELGLTWKYQNTIAKIKNERAKALKETALKREDAVLTSPFLKVHSVAGWEVLANLDQANYLQNCQATRRHDAGRSSIIRLDASGGIDIGFRDRDRDFMDVSGRPFTFFVDEKEMQYITRIRSQDEILYKIASTPQVLALLKGGREVRLHDGAASLDGSRAMLSMLEACLAALGG